MPACSDTGTAHAKGTGKRTLYTKTPNFPQNYKNTKKKYSFWAKKPTKVLFRPNPSNHPLMSFQQQFKFSNHNNHFYFPV